MLCSLVVAILPLLSSLLSISLALCFASRLLDLLGCDVAKKSHSWFQDSIIFDKVINLCVYLDYPLTACGQIETTVVLSIMQI